MKPRLGPTCLRELDRVKKVKEVSGIFVRSPLDGGVGHILVLVFVATCRHLALRSGWVGEQASRHDAFFFRN